MTCDAGHVVTPADLVHGVDVGGGTMAFLTGAQRDALKPQGDDTIEVLYLLDTSKYGTGWAPAIARLTGNAQSLVPNLTTSQSKAQATLWAGLLALLHGKVAVARVMDGGSFYHAILAPSSTGAIVVHELYLPEDAYEVPDVIVPPLPAEKVSALRAKGDELALTWENALVATDPFREARFEAVQAALRGDVPPPTPAPRAVEKEVDLLALI
jgi:hypothetical protein